MNTTFKSALNQINAEDSLVSTTQDYLISELSVPKKKGLIQSLRSNKSMKYMVAAVAVLALLASGSTAAYAYYKTPVSYLSLDINPSVELGINAFDKVVSAEGYNEDGQIILEGLDLTGDTVEDAVQSLIISADENGYIADDGSTVISLTSETDNEDTSEAIQTDSETGLTEALDDIEKDAVLHADNVALARRDEARELGITPGKLNLIQKLQAVDPTVVVADYKNATVKSIMSAIKTNSEHGNSVNKKQHNTDDSTDETTTESTTETSVETGTNSTDVTTTEPITQGAGEAAGETATITPPQATINSTNKLEFNSNASVDSSVTEKTKGANGNKPLDKVIKSNGRNK